MAWTLAGTYGLEIEGGSGLNDLALCPRFNGISLCSGYGGLELGIERVFPESRTVCYVEGELFAAQHLVKKMEEGKLDPSPIWSNVKTFNGEPWRGKVDWIAGGFPCQPYSTAGKQMGESDPRDLWPDFVRIIREVRPGFIFLENVPNIVKLRLDQIILDLDSLGYSASWGVVAASEVGARHQRKRWFCMAVLCDPNGDGFNQFRNEISGERIFEERELEGNRSQNKCEVDSYAHGFRLDENKQSSPGRKLNLEGLCGNMADSNNERLGSCCSRTSEEPSRQGAKRDDYNGGSKCFEQLRLNQPSNLQRNVSDSHDSSQFPSCGTIRQENGNDISGSCENVSNTHGKRGTKSRELFKGTNGIFINCSCETGQIIPNTDSERTKRVRGINGTTQKVEQGQRNINQGDKWGGRFESMWEVEPSMGRLVDGASDWVDKLRLLGNGVVPQQAAYAFQTLGERLACGMVENRTPKD